MSEEVVAVIGAGVVGLAVAAALAKQGKEVVILEAQSAVGTKTSSRNSEVIHAGLYYPEHTLKGRLCREGARRLYAWCSERGVAHRRIGKLIVATDEGELSALDGVYRTAASNGVSLVPWTAQQAKAANPSLRCEAALWSAETGLIDAHGLMLSLLGVAQDHGAVLALETPVLGGFSGGQGLIVRCGGREPMALSCRTVVNCAGLWAQAITRSIEGAKTEAVPKLVLAKGNYFALSGRVPFSHLIYPVPVPGGLGTHFTLDLGGAGRFGPDVEWVEGDDPDGVDLDVSPVRRSAFVSAIRRYWPEVSEEKLTPAYAGLRPKVETGDFVVQGPKETGVDGLFTLYGIESPGLTASLALAEYVARMVTTHG